MSKKVIFVGNAASGKTTACLHLLGIFPKKNPPTMGIALHFYTTPNRTYLLWDCGGKAEFRGLGNAYYQDADIAFVFYGGEKNDSLSPREWKKRVKAVSPKAKVYFVSGNLDKKCDKVKRILF
jgi:GTPase SAR1 family protein